MSQKRKSSNTDSWLTDEVQEKEIKITPICETTIRWFYKQRDRVDDKHSHEKRLYPSWKRLLAHQGGTYAGKTMSIMLAIYYIAKKSPKRLFIKVVGQTVSHLETGAQADWDTVLDCYEPNAKLSGAYNVQKRTYKVGKCTIKFLSVDKIGKAKGGKHHLLFVNEANEIKYEIFRLLAGRSLYGSIIDFNPTAPFWYQGKYYNRLIPSEYTQVLHYQSCYKQNKMNLPASKIAEIEGWAVSDPDYYQVYGLGNMGALKGLIYKKVKWTNYLPTNLDYEIYGLDWGGANSENDPTAICRVGFIGNVLYAEELYYARGSFVDIANFLFDNLPPGSQIVADTNNTHAMRTVRELLAAKASAKGVSKIRIIDAAKQKGSVDDGINFVNSFQNIYIANHSTNWKLEAENYVYKINSAGVAKPCAGNDHLWDALRYATNSAKFIQVHKQGVRRNARKP